MPEWRQQPGGGLTIGLGYGLVGHVMPLVAPTLNGYTHAGWIRHESGILTHHVLGQSVEDVTHRIETASRAPLFTSARFDSGSTPDSEVS